MMLYFHFSKSVHCVVLKQRSSGTTSPCANQYISNNHDCSYMHVRRQKPVSSKHRWVPTRPVNQLQNSVINILVCHDRPMQSNTSPYSRFRNVLYTHFVWSFGWRWAHCTAFTYIGQHKCRKNEDIHPCSEWNSKSGF